MSRKQFLSRGLWLVLVIMMVSFVWNCSFMRKRSNKTSHEIVIKLDHEIGRFPGLGANVPGSFFSRRMKPLQTFHDLGLRIIRIKRSGDNWDDLLALRAATSRLKIKWLYSLYAIPEEFLDAEGHLADVDGFAKWWAEEVDELAYQEVPADYIELLDHPDGITEQQPVFTPDQYNELIHKTYAELSLRHYDDVLIVGPGLSSPKIYGEKEAWFTDLDQTAFDGLANWTLQLHRTDTDDRSSLQQLEKLLRFLERIDSRKPLWVTSYATGQTQFGSNRYPDPAHYDLLGNQPGYKDYYYSASFSAPYGLRVYANTLDILKQPEVTPFIRQVYDAPADVKYRKESWGLLDLNGQAKPAFTFLSSLISRVPQQAMVLPAVSREPIPVNALAFCNGEELLVTLCNESELNIPVSLNINVRNRQLVFQDGSSLQAEIIQPVSAGCRDDIMEKPLTVRVRKNRQKIGFTATLSVPAQAVAQLRFRLE